MTAQAQVHRDNGVCSSTLGRLAAQASRWRVVVEAWPVEDRYRGRLVFQADDRRAGRVRESADFLSGRSVEEVVNAAYELPEQRIRVLLHSLL